PLVAGPAPTPKVRADLTIGLTGRLDTTFDAASGRGSLRDARLLVGVERALPLVRYRMDSASSRGGETTLDFLEVSSGHTTSSFPNMARTAVDVRIYGPLTLGAAASAGYLSRSAEPALVPAANKPTEVVWSIAPRAGALLALT